MSPNVPSGEGTGDMGHSAPARVMRVSWCPSSAILRGLRGLLFEPFLIAQERRVDCGARPGVIARERKVDTSSKVP